MYRLFPCLVGQRNKQLYEPALCRSPETQVYLSELVVIVFYLYSKLSF